MVETKNPIENENKILNNKQIQRKRNKENKKYGLPYQSSGVTRTRTLAPPEEHRRSGSILGV